MFNLLNNEQRFYSNILYLNKFFCLEINFYISVRQ